MYTKIYWIERFENGAALGIMPRPKGDEWLTEEIKRLKQMGIQTVVSLLEKEEMQELGLRAEEVACRANGLEYINFPIKDRNIPHNQIVVNRLIKELKQKIDSGEMIVLHCRMGVGRAAIIAGALLLQYEYTTEQIIEKISHARGLKVPDTDEQVKWLRKFQL